MKCPSLENVRSDKQTNGQLKATESEIVKNDKELKSRKSKFFFFFFFFGVDGAQRRLVAPLVLAANIHICPAN